ncbi:MAG: DNA repair protein RecO [Ruminococcaceae bacterium]|nr:DNA repair protein RecO [Oscillospiraceae bacterium]
MLFATDGIVTKVSDANGSDKFLNIITPNRGRIGVLVKGSRSPESKTASLSQLFTYGNFEIYEKNGMYWLRGGMVINPFYNLSEDIVRIAAATYMCELANELTDESDECEDILRLLLNSLYLLGRGDKKIPLIKTVFEMRAMALSGYTPDVSACRYCHEMIADEMYLDILGGRIMCAECFNDRGAQMKKIKNDFDDIREASVICRMTSSVAVALKFILGSPSEKIFSFDIKDEDELAMLSKLSETYVTSHLGRSFDSLEFYNAVKNC